MKIEKLNEKIFDIKHNDIYYIGNLSLLKKRKVAIVGTRKPINYTKEMSFNLAKKLSTLGVVVVSGSAMGVDIISQDGAFPNTISIMPCGLDVIYPKVNETKIKKIYENSLALSEYEAGFNPTKYSFVQRNRLIVALCEVLIITEADLESGSMRSFEWAQKFNKEVFVLPHRLNDSLGTNRLLRESKAKAIYDIDEFIQELGFDTIVDTTDEVLLFCSKNPTYQEALAKFQDKIFEYELYGKIEIRDNIIRVVGR